MMIVALGGALGSAARYAVSRLVQEQVGSAFPWHTLLVNVAGCLLIGLIGGLAGRLGCLDERVKLFLTMGFCGGFTTFSTFCNESLALMRGGQALLSMVYVALSVVAGLLAVQAGLLLARQ